MRNRKNDDATTDIEARRKCAALAQQLHNGADFAAVAMDYSEDPGPRPPAAIWDLFLNPR